MTPEVTFFVTLSLYFVLFCSQVALFVLFSTRISKSAAISYMHEGSKTAVATANSELETRMKELETQWAGVYDKLTVLDKRVARRGAIVDKRMDDIDEEEEASILKRANKEFDPSGKPINDKSVPVARNAREERDNLLKASRRT